MNDDICECKFFNEGDWVSSRLNHDVFGIVVSNSDFGRFVTVQLAVTLEFKQFYAVTLRHTDLSQEPPAATADDTNVVKVDFTKRRELNRDTPTGGAA